MKKSIIKISAILLIVGLNWAGLSAVGQTFAYFNDTETSSGNTFTAGTLDFSLYSPNDFFPTSPGESNQLFRDISVIKEGSLGFEYQMRTSDVVSSGPGDLCKKLLLTADLPGGGIECPAMDLASFSCGPFELSDSQNDWQLIVTPAEGHLFSQTCGFKLIFEAWQPELDFSSGFTDMEEVDNTVYGSHSDVGLGVVLNEFLPNPVGPDDGLMLEGEWVELYNRGFSSQNVSGWRIYNSTGQYVTISNANTHTGDTNIDRGEFLVIYLNGAMLDNAADTVYLKREIKIWIWTIWMTADSHSYNEADGDIILENKSFARIPDGTMFWYDPIPTPGSPNKLEEEIFEEELVVEEIPVEETPADDGATAAGDEQTEEGIIDEAVNDIVEEILPDETSGEDSTTEEITTEETTSVGETADETTNTEEIIIEEVPTIEPTESPSDIQAGEEQPATETEIISAPEDNSNSASESISTAEVSESGTDSSDAGTTGDAGGASGASDGGSTGTSGDAGSSGEE